jgi:hypothetical protein
MVSCPSHMNLPSLRVFSVSGSLYKWSRFKWMIIQKYRPFVGRGRHRRPHVKHTVPTGTRCGDANCCRLCLASQPHFPSPDSGPHPSRGTGQGERPAGRRMLRENGKSCRRRMRNGDRRESTEMRKIAWENKMWEWNGAVMKDVRQTIERTRHTWGYSAFRR